MRQTGAYTRTGQQSSLITLAALFSTRCLRVPLAWLSQQFLTKHDIGRRARGGDYEEWSILRPLTVSLGQNMEVTKKSTATRRAPVASAQTAKAPAGKVGVKLSTLKPIGAGSFKGDTSEMIKRMRVGMPASVIPDMASKLGMSQDGLFAVLRLPRSTMKSRISKNDVLSAAEQDRMYRADRVWSRAVEVFEDHESARAWVNRTNRSLGGEAPLALLDTEVGYELVLDTLGRIEQGIVS